MIHIATSCGAPGKVSIDIQDLLFLGALHRKSFEAECVAQLMARLWLIQAPPQFHNKKGYVLYDHISVNYLAEGRAISTHCLLL